MKFGKLESVQGLDLHLPEDPIMNEQTLKKIQAPPGTPSIYLGCTGWSNKEWIGSIYPPKCKPVDFLKYYSRQLGTVEMNTTHYRIPSIEQVQKWVECTEKDFRFCPKVPQSISHRKEFGIPSGLLHAFVESACYFEDRMGCCFMQLPPYFGIEKWNSLKEVLKIIRQNLPIAVEFRHPSWYQDKSKLRRIFYEMQEMDVYPVITDVAGRRDVLHCILSGSKVLIRFVGNAHLESDTARLKEWSERLAKWIQGGLSEIYFFLHQESNLDAVNLCGLFKEQLLQKLPNIQIKTPRNYPNGDAQMELF